jgi:uncharacterized membrane protein YhaH (DUF805 family)
MRDALFRFLLLTGTTGRGTYLATGVGLFGVKYVLDWTFATQVFWQSWTVLNYLIWPDRRSVTVLNLPPEEQAFGATMVAVALPFIWIGVTLTLRRLRDAGLPLALVLLFFIPLVNLLLILLLCVVPSRPAVPALPPAAELPSPRRARTAHRRLAGESCSAAFGLACVVSVAVTVAAVYLSANLLKSYGFGLFVAAPFQQGLLAAILYGLPRRRSVGACLLVATAATALSGVVLLIVALEGLACIIMAAPIALVLALIGGLVGFVLQTRPWIDDATLAMIVAVLLALPALTAAEAAGGSEPAVREVRTEVGVNAAPEQVWEQVVSFPPLPEPSDPVFRTGIAYPQRAEIHGRGVGAVRHCVFSTGAFVEPIDVWDEPHQLAFRVTDQPPPMAELSPFHIHSPHLDHFLVSHRGEFRLERLSNGRTRLVGTTWYSNRMWPADYWNLWSDLIIHQIHARVLDHVRGLAEGRVDNPNQDGTTP